MIRNQAGTIKVFAFNRTNNAPVTGDAANITCQYDLDRVGLLALADITPDETELGFYVFNVTAAECNGTTVDFYPESSTSNVQVIVVEHDRYIQQPTTVSVPIGGVVQTTVDGTTIKVSTGTAAVSVTIATVDEDGAAVDCSALTLQVVIESLDKTDITTIANGSITKTSTTVAFSIPSSCRATEKTYRWSLRNTANDLAIMGGSLFVTYAAGAD